VSAKILIVEDEIIIAKNIEKSLVNFGYQVLGIILSGAEVIKKIESLKPDLVLMDIKLNGNIDGIEAAQAIKHLGIPLIFLTAFMDQRTLEKAKKTEPFGYLLKPFEDRILFTTIETALYKNLSDKKIKEKERSLYTTLKSIGEAVITIDKNNEITFMNNTAEKICNLEFEKALGFNYKDKFNFFDTEKGQPLILDYKTSYPPGSQIVLIRDNLRIPIEINISSITDENDSVSGLVMIFRDISERKAIENKIFSYQEKLRLLVSELSIAEENERRRISKDLHDDIGQNLSLVKIKLREIEESVKNEEAIKDLRYIRNIIDSAIKYTRSLISELSPPILYDIGLIPAVEWLTEEFKDKHKIDIVFERSEIKVNFNNDIKVFLFKSIRELIVNAIKHSEATKLIIKMYTEKRSLLIVVTDNGKGFDYSEKKFNTENRGFGLFSIKERLIFLGGDLKIKSKDKTGTTVTLNFPMVLD